MRFMSRELRLRVRLVPSEQNSRKVGIVTEIKFFVTFFPENCDDIQNRQKKSNFELKKKEVLIQRIKIREASKGQESRV